MNLLIARRGAGTHLIWGGNGIALDRKKGSLEKRGSPRRGGKIGMRSERIGAGETSLSSV